MYIGRVLTLGPCIWGPAYWLLDCSVAFSLSSNVHLFLQSMGRGYFFTSSKMKTIMKLTALFLKIIFLYTCVYIYIYIGRFVLHFISFVLSPTWPWGTFLLCILKIEIHIFQSLYFCELCLCNVFLNWKIHVIYIYMYICYTMIQLCELFRQHILGLGVRIIQITALTWYLVLHLLDLRPSPSLHMAT